MKMRIKVRVFNFSLFSLTYSHAIFDMHVDNDVLYRGIANQPSHAYSSLNLSNFLFPYFE